MTLSPFLVSFATFGATKLCSLCLGGSLFGTKVGGVLPLRMRHKAMQLVLGRLAGNKTEKSQFYPSFNSILFQFRPFFGVLLLRFGHEIGCCFAVADASQSHAACAWQARWRQN